MAGNHAAIARNCLGTAIIARLSRPFSPLFSKSAHSRMWWPDSRACYLIVGRGASSPTRPIIALEIRAITNHVKKHGIIIIMIVAAREMYHRNIARRNKSARDVVYPSPSSLPSRSLDKFEIGIKLYGV